MLDNKLNMGEGDERTEGIVNKSPEQQLFDKIAAIEFRRRVLVEQGLENYAEVVIFASSFNPDDSLSNPDSTFVQQLIHQVDPNNPAPLNVEHLIENLEEGGMPDVDVYQVSTILDRMLEKLDLPNNDRRLGFLQGQNKKLK